MYGLFILQDDLHAIRFWCNHMHMLGCPYHTALITTEQVAKWDSKRKAGTEAVRLYGIGKAPKASKRDAIWLTWKNIFPLNKIHVFFITLITQK